MIQEVIMPGLAWRKIFFSCKQPANAGQRGYSKWILQSSALYTRVDYPLNWTAQCSGSGSPYNSDNEDHRPYLNRPPHR